MIHQLQREALSDADTAHSPRPHTPNVPTLPHRKLPTWRHSDSALAGGGEKRLREPRRRRGPGHCTANDWGGQPHRPWAGGGRRGAARGGGAGGGSEAGAANAAAPRGPATLGIREASGGGCGPRRCAPPGRPPPPPHPETAPRSGWWSSPQPVSHWPAGVGAAPTGGTAAACHHQRRPCITSRHRACFLHPPPPPSGRCPLPSIQCVACPPP